ncbi:MAG: IS200/IS605 family transposase, partial [Chitinophagaceae bacterium]
MTDSHTRTFLFIHVIWTTINRAPILKKPVRMVLFSFLQKNSEEKGIRIIAIQGVEDHLHVLLQLNPAQNLSQVVRSLKNDAAVWLKDTNLLDSELDWQPEFVAYS